jgi:hypothetical protein
VAAVADAVNQLDAITNETLEYRRTRLRSPRDFEQQRARETCACVLRERVSMQSQRTTEVERCDTQRNVHLVRLSIS